MSYQCRNFKIHELVSPDIYKSRGEKAWQLLDDRALWTLDALRDKYGAITVNNYFWGGDREWSGLRTHNSPYYSPTSQHSFGRAFDCIFHSHTAETIRKHIQANPDADIFKYIRGIELDVTWLHFDVRNCDRIITFKP